MCILRATRGRYGEPITATRLKFIDDDYKPASAPKLLRCENDGHSLRKWKYPVAEMFFQKWEMTDAELQEAIDQFDMASLDMPNKIICSDCKIKLEKRTNQ